MELANQAMEELKKMATGGEPLWIRSVETGREILNYDEYIKEFSVKGQNSSDGRPKRSIEASRETKVVFVDLPRLIQSFIDVVWITIKSVVSNSPSRIHRLSFPQEYGVFAESVEGDVSLLDLQSSYS